MGTERDNRLERILKWIAWATTAFAALNLLAGGLILGLPTCILAIAAWVGVSKSSLKWIAWATTAVAVLYSFGGLLVNVVFFGILAIAAWVGVSKLSKKDE